MARTRTSARRSRFVSSASCPLATSRPPLAAATLVLLLAAAACAPAGDDAEPSADAEPAAGAEPASDAVMVDLLTSGEALFGIFSGPHTPEGGTAMADNRATDFVFYSLESGPFDIPGMSAYRAALVEAWGGPDVPPIALRVPPVRDDPAAAREHVAEGLEAGVASIVFPHVVSREDASTAVGSMGAELWPGNPDGSLVAMLIVEDREGIANVRDVVSTPGVSVVFAGPGDLGRAYEGDEEAVENAIQTVLAACKEFDVPCGITAGVDDIAERLEQGFRVIIVTEAEAIPVGKRAAGRME